MDQVTVLKDYLGTFISDHKRSLFQKILQHRTFYLQVVLDQIEDPLDANAAFRSCECFGVQRVHWLQAEAGRKMRRGVSVGSTKWLDLQTPKCGATALASRFERRGIRQFALSTRSDAQPLEKMTLDRPVSLWFSSEVSGVKPETAPHMDGFVRIPMVGAGTHFNFSVTVALALQSVKQQLEQSSHAWQLSPAERGQLLLEWYATIPKKRRLLIERFLEERHMTMADLAPPVTTKRFWDMLAVPKEIPRE